VEKDQVSFYTAPLRRHTGDSEFDIGEIDGLPRVDIVSAYVGADDAPARACVEAGARGLVLNGYAFSGRAAADQNDGLMAIAASGIPVAIVNRGGGGRIPVDRNDGYLRCDSLVAHKARIVLMLGLTKTGDLGELQRMFNEY
jgi:L-asparaginase